METFEMLNRVFALIKLMPEFLHRFHGKEYERYVIWEKIGISRRTFYLKIKNNSFTFEETMNYILYLKSKKKDVDRLLNGQYQIIGDCQLEMRRIMNKKW